MEYDAGVCEEYEFSYERLRKAVQEMQEDWEEYRESAYESYAALYGFKHATGTIVGPLNAGAWYDLCMDYALRLVGIYSYITW